MILASESPTRTKILANAGIKHSCVPSYIDEHNLKEKCKEYSYTSAETALELAKNKAKKVGNNYKNRLILGADQMLECEGSWLDKPEDLEDAKKTLMFLRGRDHSLVSAIALFENQKKVWEYVDVAKLSMRDFSDQFLKLYIKKEGRFILSSVGAYRLEGMGVQLFSSISGDYFTILGLPLIPLLKFLREKKFICS